MLDIRLLRLAGRQRSLVTRRQLLELGLSRRQVDLRLESGVLFVVHREVYGLAGARQDFDFKILAACLAGGDGAVASNRCAAVVYGLRRVTCSQPEITVSGRRAPKLAWVRVHRSDLLLPGDRTRFGIIPVTTPARTLLDLAARLETDRLASALDDVLVRHLASLGALERFL